MLLKAIKFFKNLCDKPRSDLTVDSSGYRSDKPKSGLTVDSSEHQSDKPKSGLTVDFSGHQMTVNGQVFLFPLSYSEMVSAFGQPSRVSSSESMGIHYFFDDLGLACADLNRSSNFFKERGCYQGEDYTITQVTFYFAALSCQVEVTVNGQPIYFVHSMAIEGSFRFSCLNQFKVYEGYQENLTSLTVSFDPDELISGGSEFALQADDTFLEVSDINFKLAIIQELMYNQGLLGEVFDRGAFLATYSGMDGKDDTQVGLVKPALAYFEQLKIPLGLVKKLTYINVYPGDNIYLQLYRYWDDEVNCFQVTTITEADLEQLPNLEWARLMVADIEAFSPLFDKRGIVLVSADADDMF